MKIRKFRKSDIDELLNLQIDFMDSQNKLYAKQNPKTAKKMTKKRNFLSIMKKELKDLPKDTYIFVAENNSEIVGYAKGYIHKSNKNNPYNFPNTGVLGDLYVKKTFRNKGIARKLYKKTIISIQKI